MKLISRFIDLCLFRASPSDLPASQRVLKISLLTYFILSIFINRLDTIWLTSVVVSLADIFIMIMATYLLLSYRGFQTRYTQTLTALAGTGSCIAVIALPVLWQLSRLELEKQAVSLSLLLLIVLMLWSIMIMAQIFRHALDIKAGTAMLITIFYIVITIIVTGLIMSGMT